VVKILLRPWLFVLIGWIGVCAVVARPAAAQSYPPAAVPHRMISDSGKASVFEKFTSSVKDGMGKFTRMVTPKVPTKTADDPIGLSSDSKPSAELYTAVAHMYEQAGRHTEAAEQYQKALRISPEYLGALLGYARLNDQLGRTAEAEKLYRRAVESHPEETSAHNNLALFHARHGRLGESVVVLDRAVKLEPKNPKYRNNIATVLVEMGRNKEAFDHLRIVHGAAVAYYNLGYLLEKKGQTQAAEQHFALAERLDPSLAKAKRKLAQIKQPTNKAVRSVPNHLAQRPEPDVRQLSTPPPTQHNRTAPRSEWSITKFKLPPMPPELPTLKRPKAAANTFRGFGVQKAKEVRVEASKRPEAELNAFRGFGVQNAKEVRTEALKRPEAELNAFRGFGVQNAKEVRAEALKRLPPLTGGGSTSPAMAPMPPVVQHWNPTPFAPASPRLPQSQAIQPLPPLK